MRIGGSPDENRSGAEALASLRLDAESLRKRGQVLAALIAALAFGQAFVHRWMLGLAAAPPDSLPLAWIWPLLAAIGGAWASRGAFSAPLREAFDKEYSETSKALQGTNILGDLLSEDAYERLSALGPRPSLHDDFSFRRRIRDLAKNFRAVAVQAGWAYPEEKKPERNGCLMLLELYWQTWVWPLLKGSAWALLLGTSTYCFKLLGDKLHLVWLQWNFAFATLVADFIVHSGFSVRSNAWLPMIIGLAIAFSLAKGATEKAAIRLAIVAELQAEGSDHMSVVAAEVESTDHIQSARAERSFPAEDAQLE